MFEYGYLVESVWVRSERLPVFCYMNEASLLDDVFSRQDGVNGLTDSVGRDIGQESQMTGVDAEDGDSFSADAGGRSQKSSVASHRESNIGSKISLRADDGAVGQIQLVAGSNEISKLSFYTYINVLKPEQAYHINDTLVFFNLESIPEKRYCRFFFFYVCMLIYFVKF